MHCVIGILQNLLLFLQLLMHFSFGTIFLLHTVTPVEPFVQKVVQNFYAPRYMSGVAKLVIYGNSIMVERDMMIWNTKEYLHNPILLKEDKQIKLFRNWYSQFYSENSKSFLAATNDLTW
jgi:cholesterol 7-dehydrogenase